MMQPNIEIKIRPVENGFIVEADMEYGARVRSCETMVFETIGGLLEFINSHFVKEQKDDSPH